ncbi:DUF551 domain-containing protein [Hymenobacter sp. BT175]|uniref:DUF551 domain-containing protein n=1 Tax=Hymenobacter translucens TaxID=2886507 RepID=UPI001D0F41CE|nr:DUF551 domain-containing protein [Hymenobacter translucens]MCC2547683.1 DUF551 domain-containing protein [Hymenobacter translucens]
MALSLNYLNTAKMQLTTEEVYQMQMLEQAATPGPWHIGRWRQGNQEWAPTVTPEVHGAPICRFDRHGRPDKDTADSAFIAAARSFIPKALAALTRPAAPVAGPAWVSVADRLPEERQGEVWPRYNRVLIARPGCDVKTGFYENECWYAEWEDYGGEPLMDLTVTHWMPLPTAPEPAAAPAGEKGGPGRGEFSYDEDLDAPGDPLLIPCPHCQGEAKEPGSAEMPCSGCSGHGEVVNVPQP